MNKWEVKSSMYTTGGEDWKPFAVTVNNNGTFVYHFRRHVPVCDHCGARGPLVDLEGLEVCERCAEIMLESARDETNIFLERIRE